MGTHQPDATAYDTVSKDQAGKMSRVELRFRFGADSTMSATLRFRKRGAKE